MKIFKTDIYSIEMTKEEYLTYCDECNKTKSLTESYDLEEIEKTCDDIIVIDENMLDECDYGFVMHSEDFWNLINKS